MHGQTLRLPGALGLAAAVGTLVLLLPRVAGAQAPPESGSYLQPMVSANLLTFGWSGAEPSLAPTLRGPSLRAGLFFPRLSAGARVGLFSSGSPLAGYAGVSGVALDLEAAPYLWKSGRTRAYTVTGLGLGTVLHNQSARPSIVPSAGVTLGVGFQRFSEELAFGAEWACRPSTPGCRSADSSPPACMWPSPSRGRLPGAPSPAPRGTSPCRTRPTRQAGAPCPSRT